MNIIDRTTKLKARRLVRRHKRRALDATEMADSQFEKLVIRRFGRLGAVRRFVFVWVSMVLLMSFGAIWQVRTLDTFYLTNTATGGGTYREGIIGVFTNSNPLFAASSVDASVSRLLYSGLFTIAPDGSIYPDLAQGYEVDDKGLVYTVSLRTDVSWHDGENFNADDVVFTYRMLQNPLVKSPLRSSWQGVKVEKTDASTVTFTLPNALSSFIYELYNGIVPEHTLASVEPEDMRSTNFNTVQPIGTGPYRLNKLQVLNGEDVSIRQEQIALIKSTNYHGKHHNLESIIIQTYRDEQIMQQDFENQVIQSMVGLSSEPDSIVSQKGVSTVSSPLTSLVGVFFNTSNDILADVSIRKALVRATDTESIRKLLDYRVIPADSPFLRSQFAYDTERVQLGFNRAEANRLLDEAGWSERDTNGNRLKDGKVLRLRFISQSLTEYAAITQRLQQEWGMIGVDVEAILQPEEDIQLGAVSQHSYDVLLYGISIGHDPDVFAYWHSSQIDPTQSSGLNLSEFKNDIADDSLEAGRTRLDDDLRAIKYEPFLDQWRDNAPALMLYQPRFFMVVQGTFEGYASGQLRNAVERYWSVSDWKVRNTQVIK